MVRVARMASLRSLMARLNRSRTTGHRLAVARLTPASMARFVTVQRPSVRHSRPSRSRDIAFARARAHQDARLELEGKARRLLERAR